MTRILTHGDIEPAVLGGAILGGGGGGSVEKGLAAARQALEAGTVQLVPIEKLPQQALTATVALVGAPSSPDAHVDAEQYMQALTLLHQAAPGIAAINTNENGAETTVNGWLQSARSGLPLLDFACNGRAHPTGLMGALGLHRQTAFRSRQAVAGGRGGRALTGVMEGDLRSVAELVGRSAVEAGGMIAVARNPVCLAYARANGAPGAITQALAVGNALITAGPQGVATLLGGHLSELSLVSRYVCQRRQGLDVGKAELDDGTILTFVNEYMTSERKGQRDATFPDLIMTIDAGGMPRPSSSLREGEAIRLLTVPRDKLLLSVTMDMPELLTPVLAMIE
ncbi:S-methyl thiohydantoin desulfurase domain-containing protein [Labrys sp. 22185]|uniref:S-methyl thiohydantoin desulfurase domain-containing protein n=1 Tax=Labrys sp. 22185 TaxID=3453888 RepID=UPI003F8702F2